jgi:wyosine [tRNA(Phe)-imidazoG37] synthetase (radical SAM superfamily)
VPSRRLGQSLGIDTIPLKTCNWNCVYCQLGRTAPVTHRLAEYFPRGEILAEVHAALAAHAPGEIDWVTFVGSGEPTLHQGLGWLIRKVKACTDLPVAVITNGSLLYREDVRLALRQADAVLPSLDAGDQDLFRRINRPHPDSTFERLVDGLCHFRRIYAGRLWVEVMLLGGLNDSPADLQRIAEVLREIDPDEVHLNVPTRPPAETWVRPPEAESLLAARDLLGDVAHVVQPAEGRYDLSGGESLLEAVLGILTRHPMRESELAETLSRWSPGAVQATLRDLESGGRARRIERLGVVFWTAGSTRFPTASRSRRAAPRV